MYFSKQAVRAPQSCVSCLLYLFIWNAANILWAKIITDNDDGDGYLTPAYFVEARYGLFMLEVPLNPNWSFSAAGPRVWNSLPPHLRLHMNFVRIQHKLKTFLFGN